MKTTSATLVAFTLLVVYSTIVAGQDSASNIRIAGKCVDEKGLPVAEATIDLYLNSDSTKSLKTTQTRLDGSFDLGDFPDPELNPGKDVNYKVVGLKAGKAVNYAAVLAPAQKANALDLVLGVPAELKGIVTGPDGSPLQNARVRVAGYPWIEGVHGAITNKSGEYVLEGIPTLEHPGFGRQAIPNAPGLPGLFELQPLASKFLMVDHPELGSLQPKFAQCPATIDVHFNEPAKMTGRIVDGDGKPVAGVKVTARPSQAPAHRVALLRAMNSGISQGTATTGVDGQYALVLQHSGVVEINVIDQQHFAETVSDVFVQSGETVPVPDIAAIGAAFVTGRIVDVDTGKTVACPKGVRLHVYVMGEGALTSTRVRPDGTYRLPVLPGTSYVYFSSKTLDEMTKTWDVLEHPTPVPAAARQWSDEQLQSVLLHELAHIKRRDTIVQLLAQVACALHWFNPLVWLAAWRLDVERERSCDDLVLASGIRPSAYAGHLLDVVTGLSPARWTQACGLAMARKSSLEGRLTAVLGKDLNRRDVSLALAGLGLAIAVGIVVPIAMLRAADEKWNPHQAAHIGTNDFSAYCVHDGKDASFVIAYHGDFGSATESVTNPKTRTWTDSGTITAKKPGIALTFHRTHTEPGKLSITTAPAEVRDLSKPAPPPRELGHKEYDLTKGRVFLLSDNGSVRQFDLPTPVVTDQESAKELATLIAAIPPQQREDLDHKSRTTMKLLPEAIAKLKWGEPVNGLRMALAYPPALGDALLGKKPHFELVVQNVSEKEIHFLASDEAPNPRRMLIREGERIVQGLRDHLEVSPADWKLLPGECGVLRLFATEESNKAGTVPSSAIESILSKSGRYHAIVEMEIVKAPPGAWTGKLDTGPTRGSADVAAAPAPMHKDARALYENWQMLARANGDIPGALVGELAAAVRQFIKYNPTWETVPKLSEILLRLDATHDWKPADAIALLDEVAAVKHSPLTPAPWKGTRSTIRKGEALPKKFADVAWGESQPNGLHAAWVLEPNAAEHRLGAALNARLLVRNTGSVPVVLQVPTFHQGGVKATDAKGAEVQVSGISWTTMALLNTVRLGPGEYIEINTPGIGFGPRAGMGPWAGPRVGSNVLAKAGDELTLTHGLVPLDGSEVGVSEDDPHVSGPGWWLAHIKTRLNRELPLPADAAERTRLLDRAVRELFATAPTAEETAEFIADKTPDALDALAKRLVARVDVESFSGKLPTAPAKFRVLAADANADKQPRVVLGPGEYPLPSATAERGDATLKIVGRPVGDRRTNDAQLIFEAAEFTGALPPDPHKLEVPDGWGTWAIVCRPDSDFFYLLSKGTVRKIDYSNPRNVTDTPANDLPVEFRDEVKRQLDIAGVSDAQQAEIFEKPGAPAATPDSQTGANVPAKDEAPPASEAPKVTEKKPFTAWGEEVNGVQIGVQLGEPRTYEVGENATLILRLRNNGKVQVPYRYGDEYFLKNPPLITDASGKAVTIKAMSVFGSVRLESVAPGKEVDLVQLKLDLRPATDRSKEAAWTIYGTGKFQIQYPVAGVVGEVGPDLPGMKLTTGKLELEVKEPFTAWGEAINGLQAGLGFKAGEKRAYSHDETVRLVVRVRNVGKEEVKFQYLRECFHEKAPTVTDGKGKPVDFRYGWLDTAIFHMPMDVVLAPGKEIELSEVELLTTLLGTGKLDVQYERVLGNSTMGRITLDPNLSKLATGKLELEVKEPEKLPPEKEPFTAWGKQVGGLQAGLGFLPGQKRAYTHGETATLVLRVRNVGMEAVEFKHIWAYFVENPPAITDADGKRVQLPRLQAEGEHGSDNPKIAPGKAVELYEWKLELSPETPRFGRNIKPSTLYGTGKFSLQCERIVGPTSANPQDPNPAMSKLATGKLELVVKEVPAKKDESPAADEQGLRHKEKLQGSWQVVEAHVGGTHAPRESSEEQVWTFTREKLAFDFGDSDPMEMTYRIDEKQVPPTIDLSPLGPRDKGSLYKGIYELDGDQLKVHFTRNAAADSRPTEFKPSGIDRGMRYFVLKRAPKAETAEKEIEPFTAWGEPIGGLQAGLGFKAGEQRAYTHGETATLVVRVRNVGKEDVKFEYLSKFFEENPPNVTDGEGKPVWLGEIFIELQKRHIPVEANLAAGKEIELYELKLELSSGAGLGIPKFPTILGTGKFQFQYEKVLGNSSSGSIKLDPTLSKLATGKLELEVKEPAADPPKTETAKGADAAAPFRHKLAELDAKIVALKMERLKLSETLSPNHPKIRKLDAEVEAFEEARASFIATNSQALSPKPPGANIVKIPDDQYVKSGVPVGEVKDVVWNETQNGLSLGYRITDDEWRILGRPVDVELWVRNTGDKDVKFQSTGRNDHGLRVLMTGKDGKEHEAQIMDLFLAFPIEKLLLPSSHAVKVREFSVVLAPPGVMPESQNPVFALAPGEYKFRCEHDLIGTLVNRGNRKPLDPPAIVRAGLLKSAEVDVKLVAADAPPPKPRIEHADVNLEKDGTLYLNRKKVTLDELKAQAAKDEKKEFTIRADKDVPYAKVIEVVDALKAAGVTEFSFSEARVGDGKYRVANRTGTYEFDDKHGFSICRPSERPQWFTVSWPAEGDRPACALRTFPNVGDKTDGKWAVVWEPGTDVLWWVDDSEVGKMTLTDPARVIVDREGRTNNFSRDFGLPEEVKTEFRRLGFVIGRDKTPGLEKTIGGNRGGQTIVSAEFGWWYIEGTVTDADGKPLANVPVRVSTNQEIKTEKTDAKGAYRVNFSLPLQLLAHSRAVTVKPVLEGFTERDMAKSGKFNVLLRAGEEPQRVRLADDKDFQPGPIPRFAERDLLPSQHGASPGKPGRADFVMLKAGEITSEIVPADGSGRAPVKVEAVAPSEGGAALKPDAVRVVDGAAPELRKSPPYNFRDSDHYRALDESSRSRLKTVVDDLAQLERALDSFMKDHDGTPPETLDTKMFH